MAQEDQYLPCSAYENKPAHPSVAGFSVFTDETDKQLYFALVGNDGEVLLKSEGYPLQKARETGINSVLKNLALEERYVVKSEDGKFYVSLRAGNRKEIARSCSFAKEADAQAFVQKLVSHVPGKPSIKEAAKATKPAKAAAKAEATTSKASASKTPKKAAAPQPKELPLSAYIGHETLWNDKGEQTGYASFEAEGLHYFVVYNQDGSIFLHSKGHKTAKQRDSKLEKVQQFIVLEESYKVLEDEPSTYIVHLMDDKGDILASSTPYGSFIEAYVNTPAGTKRDITDGVF